MIKLFRKAFIAIAMLAVSMYVSAALEKNSRQEIEAVVAEMNDSFQLQSSVVNMGGVTLEDNMMVITYVFKEGLLDYDVLNANTSLSDQIVMGLAGYREKNPQAFEAFIKAMKDANIGIRTRYVEENTGKSVITELSADELLAAIKQYSPQEAARKNILLQVAGYQKALPRQIDDNTIWTNIAYEDNMLQYTYNLVGISGADFNEEQMKYFRDALYSYVKQSIASDDVFKGFVRLCSTAESGILFHYVGDGIDIPLYFSPDELKQISEMHAGDPNKVILQMLVDQLMLSLPEVIDEGLIWTNVDYANDVFSMTYKMEGISSDGFSEKELKKLKKTLYKTMDESMRSDDMKDMLQMCVDAGADFKIIFAGEDFAIDLDYPLKKLQKLVK